MRLPPRCSAGPGVPGNQYGVSNGDGNDPYAPVRPRPVHSAHTNEGIRSRRHDTTRTHKTRYLLGMRAIVRAGRPVPRHDDTLLTVGVDDITARPLPRRHMIRAGRPVPRHLIRSAKLTPVDCCFMLSGGGGAVLYLRGGTRRRSTPAGVAHRRGLAWRSRITSCAGRGRRK